MLDVDPSELKKITDIYEKFLSSQHLSLKELRHTLHDHFGPGINISTDESGKFSNIIIKKHKMGIWPNGERGFIRPGMHGIRHSFVISPDGITAMGRTHEGAYLGRGSFGSVRMGLRWPIPPDAYPPVTVAIKTSAVSPEYTRESESLRLFGKLLSHGVAETTLPGGPYSRKAYIVQPYHQGRNLAEIRDPKPSFLEVINHLRKDASSKKIIDDAFTRFRSMGWETPLDWHGWQKVVATPLGRSALGEAAMKLVSEASRTVAPMHASSQKDSLGLAIAFCQQLYRIHSKGFVHRDIKGGNTMGNIIRDGRYSAYDVNIVDLGLTIPIDTAKSIRSDSGTPSYMAPEAQRLGIQTPESDIFSAGMVLTQDLRLDLPIARKMLDSHPLERPQLPIVIEDLKIRYLLEILKEYSSLPKDKDQNGYNFGRALGPFFPELRGVDNITAVTYIARLILSKGSQELFQEVFKSLHGNTKLRNQLVQICVPDFAEEAKWMDVISAHKSSSLSKHFTDKTKTALIDFNKVLDNPASTLYEFRQALQAWQTHMNAPSGSIRSPVSRREKYYEAYKTKYGTPGVVKGVLSHAHAMGAPDGPSFGGGSDGRALRPRVELAPGGSSDPPGTPPPPPPRPHR